jgi:hypothetical protein
MSRGPAVLATAVAVALINAALAALIVEAVGAPLAPIWVPLALLAAGVVVAAGAVVLWRRYLTQANAGAR